MADELVRYEKLSYYKYRADLTIIDAGKTEGEQLRDLNVTAVSIHKNFATNFFPILKIDLSLSSEMYYRLKKYRNQFKVSLRLKRFEVVKQDDYENNLYGDKTFSFTHNFDGIFQPFSMDINPFVTEDIDERNEDYFKEKDLLNEPEAEFNPMELYLFNLDHLNSNKTIINAIIEKEEVTNVIGFALTKAKIKSLLINQPDNKKIYDQILLPPLNLKNTMEYLSRSYGIFKSGLRQFLDFDTYYLLSNDMSNVPVRSNEFENVYMNIGKLTNPSANTLGSYKDYENSCYVINLPNLIDFSSHSQLSKEVQGNKLKIFDRTSIEKSVNYDEKSGKFSFNNPYKDLDPDVDGYNANDKVSFLYNHYGNDYLASELKQKKEEENLSLTIPIPEGDLEMFTPNKRFIIRFEDSKIANEYNGVYRLDNLVLFFNRDNSDSDLTLQVVGEFKQYRKA